MNVKDRLEFGKILSAYVEHIGKYPNDQHQIIAGALAIESVIDGIIDRAVNAAITKHLGDSGLKMTVK